MEGQLTLQRIDLRTERMTAKVTRKEITDRILQWGNRADMARKQGNDDLVRSALEHQMEWQKRLDELEPEFEGGDQAPPNPSGVPRIPRPINGGAGVALRVPKPEEDHD